MTNITCVTVTYGQRADLLKRVLDGLRTEPVTHVIVVDNGASWPVSEVLKEKYGDFVSVIPMGRNTGSAAGYATGLRQAAASDADFILLLDDDNLPQPGCVDVMLAAYSSMENVRKSPLALLAFRPEHQPDVAAGVPLSRINLKNNSFRGFHIRDLPYKLIRRFRTSSDLDHVELPRFVGMEIAPYSGLFFHRRLIDEIGVPRADFVLYTDDSEFTYRITRKGGEIVLVTDARIDDLESSWNARKARKVTSFDIILNQGSDLRVYYGTRNGVYFGRYCRPSNRWISWLNRRIYLAVLSVKAKRENKMQRYRLVLDAVGDGLRGKLGEHPGFPLQ